MLDEGDTLLNETNELRAIYRTKNQGSGINAGTAVQHFASQDDCEQEVARLRQENELLLKQLADNERIIQLQEQLLKK